MESIEELKARILEYEKGMQADQVIRSIAANSPSNIMVLDRDAHIQFINHTVPGITPEEMVGLCLPEIVDAEYRQGIVNALERVAASGETDKYETAYTSPSGDVSWWQSSVGPVVQNSEVTGYIVVSTNATEQRRQIEEQERFFNLSVDIMCVAGFDGYFKRVNQAFKETLSYDGALPKSPFFDFVHPNDLPAVQDIFNQLALGGKFRDFNIRCLSANGTYRLLSWRGVADIKNDAIYAVARDITDEKSLSDQLQQSRRMEAVGQLAGGIAHDFNNLLTAIQGSVELALTEPKIREASLNTALEATSRAASLTQQLLIFSRNKTLTPKVLNINPLLDSLMSLLKRLLPENITINLLHAVDAPPILADQSQIEQVVVNLCVNARDAMPEGGRLELAIDQLTITDVSGKHADAALGEYLVLSVSDTGCGMTPEVQLRIFEPFFTTKDIGKGTGLGLATVYGIVQKHKGFIELESKLNEGSCFRIHLPTTRRAIADPEIVTSPPKIDKSNNESILLAEDDSMVRTVASRMLMQAGYNVLVANDGREALEVFKEHADELSLALLDVVMPKLGGIETAEQLRAIQPELKVIFCSGHVQSQSDQNKLKQEIFLAKPYQREELLTCVRNTLDATVANKRI